MTVIAFPRRPAGGAWRAGELNQIMQALAPQLGRGEAGGWDVGETETGDPQFYVLRPSSDEECMLCVSRLGRWYVLEDGAGQVLFEHSSLAALAEQLRSMLQKEKARMVARLAVLWCAIREAFEQKLEPVMVEGEELVIHIVPQLAALA